MSNAVQLAVAGFLSGRNRLINGSCIVAQRGVASVCTTGTASYGAADRWKNTNGASNGTLYMSQTSMNDLAGIPKACVFNRVDVAVTTIGTSNWCGGFYQAIEGYNAYDLLGKQVTVSFLFKATLTGIFSVILRDGSSTYSCVQAFSYLTANATQYVSVTFPAIPSAAAIPNSSAAGLVLQIGSVAGATITTSTLGSWLAGQYCMASGSVNWVGTLNAQINVASVQLEEGSVATPFERRSYGHELMLCQRYYQIINALQVYLANAAQGTMGTYVALPVQMRATPTFGVTATTSLNISAPTAYSQSSNGFLAGCTVTTGGQQASFIGNWTLNADL
jgi:hypothetical protein